jgi:transposase
MPLIEVLHSLDEKIALLDGEISRRAEEDEDARRLKTIPGIGPVTARRSAPWPLRRRASREDATSPPG